MKIVYDDMYEFSEVVIRCNDTVRKNKCQYCPFYDRCQIDLPDNRHIQCGEINHPATIGFTANERGGEK